MKKLLLSLVAGFAALSTFAESVDFKFTSSVNQNEDPVTITVDKAQGSTAPVINSSTHLRLYAKNTFTVSVSDGYYLTDIEFTTMSSNGSFLSGASTNVGTFNATGKSWTTGDTNTTSVTLTNGTVTSGHTRISAVKVTYGGNSSKETVVLEWSKESDDLNIGETFEQPILSAKINDVESLEAKAVVEYYSSNTDLLTVADDGTMTLSPNSTGEAIVTASIPASNSDFMAKSVEYKLTVVDPNNLYDDIDFSTKGYSNQQEISEVNQGQTTLTFDKGTNSTTPKYFNNNQDVRLYGGGSLTISVPEQYVLTKVESTFNNTSNSLSADNGSFNADFTTWTADKSTKNSVKFTESGSSGNRSWKTIKVYYTIAQSDPEKEDSELAFAESEIWATVGVDEIIDGPALTNVKGVEVVYSSGNENVATVASDGKVTIVGYGTTRIEVEPADTEKYFGYASYTLTVYNFGITKIADIAAANAASGDKFPVLCPLTVGYINGRNCYVTDGQGGYIQLYADKAITEVEDGDVIAGGWIATYSPFNELPELVISTVVASGEKGEYDVVMISNPAEAELNQIVLVDFVTFDEATETDTRTNFNGSVNSEDWQFRNTYGLASVEAGEYCVKTIVSTYYETKQLIPLAFYDVPVAPSAVDYGTDNTIDLSGKEYVEIKLTHADTDNHTIYHKFADASTPAVEAQALIIDDGHEPYTEAIKVTKAGTLTFYAKNNTTGAKSKTMTLQFTGSTVGIVEVSAEGEGVELFDLQGRRVNGNARGILVSKHGKQLRR